ncbi:SMI1/KNR4 family protein [Kitasatospora sp. NPDC048407]|uniref:SMI1/KNR4 family protein n=1 Tax=Kitasatospora sp. NPDC048407 TaxID=3364051 RepID=UPI003712A65A
MSVGAVRYSCPTHTEHPDPAELAALRDDFAAAGGSRALGWAGVHAFEAEHGVVLPEPYRTFVAEIADGSPVGSPFYGLVPVAELPTDWGADRRKRVLARAFPLVEQWAWEDDEDTPEEELDDTIEPVFNHGSVVLGTDGCGMFWHLIVTGQHRGHVWFVDGEGATPFGAPFGGTTATPGFAGWVAHWAEGKEWFDAKA